MNSIVNFINSFTPQQWFLFGGLIASLPGTYAIVEFVKNHHFKKKAEELWSGFVVLNVLLWSNVLVLVDVLSANFSQLTHIMTLWPQLIGFVSVWGPRVSGLLLVIHIVATVVLKASEDAQAGKPIENVNVPDLSAQVQAITTPVPRKSFGTAAAGVDVVAANDLLVQ